MKQGVSRLAQRAGATLLLAACTYTGEGENPTATAPDEVEESDTSTDASTSTSTSGDPLPQVTSTDASDTSSGEPTSTTSDGTTGDDTTGTTGGTTGGTKTCKKVDFLFMIENESEMAVAYKELGELFPHVAERVETELSDWDYHMMVINGDGNWGTAACEERCALTGSCEPLLDGYPCEYDPNSCDMTLGAGVTFPAGSWASNVQCPIEGDQRYIVNGQPDLAGTLDCLRWVGNSGDTYRKPVQSVLEAVSPELNGPGACNEGFIRDDAYQVIMVITTSGDFTTTGTPEEWADSLLAIHGGKFDKVFLIGLFNDGYYTGTCGTLGAPYTIKNLLGWIDGIFHSSWGSVCENDFRPYIDQALDYILSDCEE
ncbi:MAG: hypothetical protein H6711_23505 [Myxococcales bacterium]|nr:hypothetical protein [Myxococcales bacterium]